MCTTFVPCIAVSSVQFICSKTLYKTLHSLSLLFCMCSSSPFVCVCVFVCVYPLFHAMLLFTNLMLTQRIYVFIHLACIVHFGVCIIMLHINVWSFPAQIRACRSLWLHWCVHSWRSCDLCMCVYDVTVEYGHNPWARGRSPSSPIRVSDEIIKLMLNTCALSSTLVSETSMNMYVVHSVRWGEIRSRCTCM